MTHPTPTDPLCEACKAPASDHHSPHESALPLSYIQRGCTLDELDVYRAALAALQAENERLTNVEAVNARMIVDLMAELEAHATDRVALRARVAQGELRCRPAVLPDLDLGYDAATCDNCGKAQVGEEAEEPLCDECWTRRTDAARGGPTDA